MRQIQSIHTITLSLLCVLTIFIAFCFIMSLDADATLRYATPYEENTEADFHRNANEREKNPYSHFDNAHILTLEQF